MYLIIEETTYEHSTPSYFVKSQDESFSNAQNKRQALELLNEKSNVTYYITPLAVKVKKTA